jgi:hypothetical protein
MLTKNTIVLSVVSCMIVNGFVPKNFDINKNSLFLIMALATHNAVIDVFKRCNDSLTIISSKVSKDLRKLIFQIPISSDMSSKKESQNNSGKDDATDSNVVVINNITYSSKTKKTLFESSFVLNGVFISVIKLFKLLYMNYKISLEERVKMRTIFLMFIVFIFAIRQRKIIADIVLFNRVFLVENKNLGIQVAQGYRDFYFLNC